MPVKLHQKLQHQRKHERLIMAALLVVMIAIAVTSCGCAEQKGQLVTEQYTVQAGDTLDAISYRYMEKSTVRRDVREFREGIIEENWEVFEGRYPYAALYVGDRLQINYWVGEK